MAQTEYARCPEAESENRGEDLCARVLAPDTSEALAAMFRALSDPTRVRIISALTGGPACVGELADAVEMTISAVSHQLRMLRTLRVVRAERAGRHVIYALDDEHIIQLYQYALEHVSHA
jgi:ArsR family transcriptional regulator, lead/cadmium/zinc/bismuth-responsive transcriptional repressor